MDNKNDKQNQKPSWHSIIINDNWCLVAIGIPLLPWVIWISAVCFGLPIDSPDPEYGVPGDELTAESLLKINIFSSAIFLPIAIYRFRRTRMVLTHGIETPFRITRKGLLHAAMRNIEIEYRLNGKAFRKRLSVSMHQADGKFRLLVNPQKPTHIAIRDLE